MTKTLLIFDIDKLLVDVRDVNSNEYKEMYQKISAAGAYLSNYLKVHRTGNKVIFFRPYSYNLITLLEMDQMITDSQQYDIAFYSTFDDSETTNIIVEHLLDLSDLKPRWIFLSNENTPWSLCGGAASNGEYSSKNTLFITAARDVPQLYKNCVLDEPPFDVTKHLTFNSNGEIRIGNDCDLNDLLYHVKYLIRTRDFNGNQPTTHTGPQNGYLHTPIRI